MATDRLVKILEQGKLITRGCEADGAVVLIELDDDTSLDYTFDWSGWLGSDTIASTDNEATGPTVTEKSATTTQVVLTISGNGGLIEHRITTTTSGETQELRILVNSPPRQRGYFPAGSFWRW